MSEPASSAPENGAPLLEIRELTKTFGSVISLSGVSTTVRAGEVTCVLGDNAPASPR